MEPHLSSSQIDELLQLAMSRVEEGAVDRVDGNVQVHLETCKSCQEMVRAEREAMRRFAQLEIDTAEERGAECPPDSTWLQIAVGVAPDGLQGYLSHAAECDHCGPLLRGAIEDLAEEVTARSETWLANPAGSVPQSQDSLVARLISEQHPGDVEPLAKSMERPQATSARKSGETEARVDGVAQPFVPLPSRPRHRLRFWALCATAASLLFVLGIRIWNQTHPSNDILIARAYDARRLTDLRIPGGDPVSLYSPTRGASDSQEWPELLKAKLAAEEGLRRDPGSSYWHQIMGRVLLLQSDPKSALAELELAYTKNPNLARIQFDLGGAYFELGSKTGDRSNYGYAAENFSRFMDAGHATDTVALYNRALCWKRMGSNELALNDFKEALKYEKQEKWQQDIRQQIENLKRGPNSTTGELEQPSAILWKGFDSNADAYELGMKRAFQGGFDFQDPARRSFLKNIAVSGASHDDFWMSDWLERSSSRPTPDADGLLAGAVRANDNGEAERAITLARHANDLYAATHDQPGVARAAIEEIYALQRMGHAQDCLLRIREVQSSKTLVRYSYLRGFLLLEEGSCLEMAGLMEQSRDVVNRALIASSAANFPILYARGQGFLASFFTLEGKAEEGWNANVEGLRFCSRFRCPEMRQYQFLSDLTDGAILLGLNKVAVYFASAGVQHALSAGNSQISAYAFEVLGQRQLACGQVGGAKGSFLKADSILAGLGDNPTSREYRADWSSDRSELIAEEGRQDLALENMAGALQDITAAQSLLIQLNYWTRRALLERAAHKPLIALSSAERAVEDANRVFDGMQSPADRRAWQANARLAYLTLVDLLIQNNRTEEALETWEDYRSAPDLVGGFHSVRASLGPGGAQAWSPPTGKTLVYVRLIDRYVVFVLGGSDKKLHVIDLRIDSNALDQLVRTFSLLCTDPRSQVSEVKAVGSQLYFILLSKVIKEPASELKIDFGPSLAGLPFSALTGPDGNYLGERTTIISLPAFWTRSSRSAHSAFSSSSRMLIVEASGLGPQATAIPIIYDESKEVAKRFAYAEVLDDDGGSRGRILRELHSADIFHFSGHAIDEGGSTRLLLASTSYPSPAYFSSESLDGITIPHCKLVVLAGCNTLGGQSRLAQLNLDLPAAFLKAGAVDVIASVWDVDSESTKILMLAFYDELLEGKDPAMALHIAENRVRTNPAFQHPYYWSAFSVIEGNT